MLNNMEIKTRTRALKKVTISREEYEMLKKNSKVNVDLVNQVKRSLEDIKHGRVTEWKSSK